MTGGSPRCDRATRDHRGWEVGAVDEPRHERGVLLGPPPVAAPGHVTHKPLGLPEARFDEMRLPGHRRGLPVLTLTIVLALVGYRGGAATGAGTPRRPLARAWFIYGATSTRGGRGLRAVATRASSCSSLRSHAPPLLRNVFSAGSTLTGPGLSPGDGETLMDCSEIPRRVRWRFRCRPGGRSAGLPAGVRRGAGRLRTIIVSAAAILVSPRSGS